MEGGNVCLELDGQHLGDRRAGPAALCERPPATQHEQATAALAHEVGEHAQLIIPSMAVPVALDRRKDEVRFPAPFGVRAVRERKTFLAKDARQLQLE